MRTRSPYKAFAMGLLLGCFSGACVDGLKVQTQKVEDYKADLAMCRANIPPELCEEFVICQHSAQRAYGYPLTGSCAPLVLDDAGADSSGGL